MPRTGSRTMWPASPRMGRRTPAHMYLDAACERVGDELDEGALAPCRQSARLCGTDDAMAGAAPRRPCRCRDVYTNSACSNKRRRTPSTGAGSSLTERTPRYRACDKRLVTARLPPSAAAPWIVDGSCPTVRLVVVAAHRAPVQREGLSTGAMGPRMGYTVWGARLGRVGQGGAMGVSSVFVARYEVFVAAHEVLQGYADRLAHLIELCEVQTPLARFVLTHVALGLV